MNSNNSREYAKLIGWTSAFLVIVGVWFLYDIQSMSIDYERHNYLIDARTGQPRRPQDVYDLNKIINQSEQYIESTNAMERLYDLSYNLNLENPFQLDQAYTNPKDLALSGWPVANQTRCGHQLDWILGRLNESAHSLPLRRGRLGQELIQLVDSFGKPEAGLYSGLITWLGSYESCRQLKLNGGLIKTRYCFARMRPIWWPKNELASSDTIIRIGSCLPETCDTNSFAHHKSQLQQLIKFDLPDFWRQGLEFESLFCLPDERSPIRRMPESGWIYIYVVSVWLAAVLTGSIVYERIRTKKEKMMIQMEAATAETKPIDTKQQLPIIKWSPSAASSMGAQVAEALSIRYSFKAFKTNRFRVRYGQGERVRVDLSMLDCIRILMALGVVLGHSGYLWSLYTRTQANRIANSTGGLGRMSLSLNRCVDTFFFFFGLLATYTMMRKFSTRQLCSPLTWCVVNAGIFLRITPLFMLVFWYSKSVSPYTASGPWWDYGVHQYSQKGVCRADPWWRSVPLLGRSSHLPAPACLLPGWFIVSYSQLALLLPLITYIICKLPNHACRILLVSITSLLSVGQLAIKLKLQTSVNLEHLAGLGNFAVDLMEKFESTGFMSTLGKLGSVAVGCFAGYLLKQYESGDIAQWPRWMRSKVTLVAVIMLHLLIIFLPVIGYYLTQHHTTTITEIILSNIVLVLLWPILNAILVIICTTTYNSHYVIRYTGHSFWRVFNKLGLCLYLIHWEVISVGVTSFEQAPSHGFFTDVMKLWAFGVFFSLILALILHILFEAPLAALTTLLFTRLLSSGDSSRDSKDKQSTGGEQASESMANIELPPSERKRAGAAHSAAIQVRC